MAGAPERRPMPLVGEPLVEHAVWYGEHLGAVFPVRRDTKQPYTKHGFKDASTDETAIRMFWAKHPTANIGLALPAGWLVIDVDARNDGVLTLHELEATYTALPRTLTSLTGSGGGSAHYCYLLNDSMNNVSGKLGQGLDTRLGEKHYIILPPSIHASGQRYMWESDYGPDDIAPQPAPAWVMALLAQPSTNGTSGVTLDPEAVILEGAREDTLTRIGGAMRRQGANVIEMRAAFEALNARMEPPLAPQDLDRVARSMGNYAPAPPPATMDVKQQANGSSVHYNTAPPGQSNMHIPRESAANTPPPALSSFSWYEKHIKPFTTKTGKVEANNTTIMAVLQNHPDWVGHLWWDDMASKLMRDETELTDASITELGAELGYKYQLPVHSDALLQRCLVAVCQEAKNKRDPLQHWLSSLPPWDGEERLETWLLDCGGLVDTPYRRFCSKILPVSMIARALDPGCICRYVLILEGPEEYRKSTFVASLVPRPEWCDELTGSLDNKEAHLMVQGLWVAELAELDSLPRTEETKLKSFISMRVDAHIPKFKSMRVRPLRRTIFVGTTNDSCYLPPGGNTRFFPLTITHPMDVEGFLAIREQLYAEAMHYYHGNPEQWWRMGPEAETEAMEQREQRRQVALIEDDFQAWLTSRRFTEALTRTPAPDIMPVKHETSLREIMLYYYNLEERDKWTNQLKGQVYAALKALGWKPLGTTRNGERVRIWTFNPFEKVVL